MKTQILDPEIWNSGSSKFYGLANKIGKMRVYLFWDFLDLVNGSVCPSRLTGSIPKFLMDFHEKFWQKQI